MQVFFLLNSLSCFGLLRPNPNSGFRVQDHQSIRCAADNMIVSQVRGAADCRRWDQLILPCGWYVSACGQNGPRPDWDWHETRQAYGADTTLYGEPIALSSFWFACNCVYRAIDWIGLHVVTISGSESVVGTDYRASKSDWSCTRLHHEIWFEDLHIASGHFQDPAYVFYFWVRSLLNLPFLLVGLASTLSSDVAVKWLERPEKQMVKRRV